MGPRTKSSAASADPATVGKLVRVRRARYVRDYVVEFAFTDGSKRQIDLDRYLWGPVFESVRDLDYFRKFRVNRESGTIVWPNGADIDPDVLFLDLTPASRETGVY